jgi:hypothetical protein
MRLIAFSETKLIPFGRQASVDVAIWINNNQPDLRAPLEI